MATAADRRYRPHEVPAGICRLICQTWSSSDCPGRASPCSRVIVLKPTTQPSAEGTRSGLSLLPDKDGDAEVLTAPQEAPVATDRALPDDEKQRRADAAKRRMAATHRNGPEGNGAMAWHDRRNGMDRPIDMMEHGDVVARRELAPLHLRGD